jgi:hypothetical protein
LFAHFFIFDCIYSENDDVAMQIIANGTLSGVPNPYLYLTSTKIGWVLNKLYSYDIDANWYFIYIIFSYSLFFCLSIFLMLDSSFNSKKRWLKILTFSLIMFLAVLKLQFTIIAILLVFLAFIFFIAYLRHGKQIFFFVGLFLLVYAVLIRYDVLYVFLFIFSLPIGYLFISRGKWMKIGILTFTIFLLISNNFFEKSEMNSVVGFDFAKFVKDTETILDNPNAIDLIDLEEAGFNRDSYRLLNNYFFIDSEVNDHESISELASGNKGIRNIGELFYVFFLAIFQSWFFILLIIFSMFFIRVADKSKTLVFLTSTLIILLLLFLALFFRLPYHVAFPLFFILFLLRLNFGNFRFGKRTSTFLLIALALFLVDFAQKSAENKGKLEVLNEFVDLLHQNEDLIFQTALSSEIPFEALGGFENKLLNSPRNLLVFGWLINTPAYNSQLRKLNIENHFKFLIRDKRVRMISNSNVFVKIIESQSKVQYNKDIVFIIDSTTANYTIYKIVR